jgi:hypothetical protein
MDFVNTVMNHPAVVGVVVHLGELTLNSRDEISAPYLVGFRSKLPHYLVACNAEKLVNLLGKMVMSQNWILESTEARLRVFSGTACFHSVRNL